MYRILLAVGENEERALAQVAAIEALPQAADEVAVDLVHVHDEGSAGGDVEWAAGGFTDEYAAQMEALEREGRPDSVSAAVERLRAAGLEHDVHAASGDPAGAILSAGREFDSDAIYLGAKRQSPVGKVLFGSVAQAVILDCDRPVTMVPPE